MGLIKALRSNEDRKLTTTSCWPLIAREGRRKSWSWRAAACHGYASRWMVVVSSDPACPRESAHKDPW